MHGRSFTVLTALAVGGGFCLGRQPRAAVPLLLLAAGLARGGAVMMNDMERDLALALPRVG